MKKKLVVTLELDTIDQEPTEEQIKADIEQEINCATYSYNVESIEFQSKIEPVPSHEDVDGVPRCGACGWVQSYGCNYCDNCGKRLRWE